VKPQLRACSEGNLPVNGDIRISEDDYTENKQSLNEWREIVESIAAFASANGGTVRIGIDPAGRRVGVQLGRRSLENLADQIKNNTEPPQFPTINWEGDEASAVVLVRVDESSVKPVWAFGRPYKRVGRTNQRLSREEAQRLQELTTGRTWDALPCRELRQADIDRASVEQFLSRAGQDISTTTEGVLRNMGLLVSEGLCNGAAVLFARNPQQFVPGAQVKCARFRGRSSVEFLDEQTLDGNVLTQIGEALAFAARTTMQGIRITGRAERETVPEYPSGAIREAIINAVCHRDYANPGTVQLRIYDDRLEVWNPGALPPDLTVEALYREHPSRPRNRLLAQALHRVRFIEQWGTGTLRIIQECEAAGLPRPEFRSEMGTFMVCFAKAALPSPEGGADFARRVHQALAYAGEHGRMTSGEYAALLGRTQRQAQRDLAAMVEQGLLARKGAGSRTYYELP
jgi:ATP-dependent DNA helicase RecG